jgi:FkbM family methyltransferase
MLNGLIGWGRRTTGKILPEGRFKKFLRTLLPRDKHYYDHVIDDLNKIVSEAALLKDGAVLVKLNDGIIFYAQRDKEVMSRAGEYLARIHSRYGNNHILAKIETFEYFGTLWRQIREQYRDDVYQKYYKIRKGDIIVDVGAHIGTFAVRAATIVGQEGRVVAIEPETDNLKFLRKNIQDNKLHNVVIVPKAIWSSQGKLKFFIAERTGRHGLINDKDQDPNKFIEVEVDTLDNILKDVGISKIDFIKMDIEGAEVEAYQGMKETLKNNNVKLAIAAYHTLEGLQKITRWLHGDKFEVFVREGYVYAEKKLEFN